MTAQSSNTPVTQPMEVEVPKNKRRRGCIGCFGCLGAIVVIVVLCAGAYFFGEALLQAAGLIPESAEELYSGAPDPAAGAAIQTVLEDAGFEGAKAVVLPTKGRNSQLAVVMMDSSTKVQGSGEDAAREAFMKLLGGMAGVNSGGFNIDRLVASFHDENGDPLIAMTASQKAIDDFNNGRTRRNEFLREVDVDISALLNAGTLGSVARRENPELLELESQLDAEFAAGLAVEWAVEKNLLNASCPAPYDAHNCDISVNPTEVAIWQASQNKAVGFGMNLLGARDVDQEAAAALGAARVAADLTRAESLADEGLATRNVAKIDQAIALRPKDWSIRDRRAAFMLVEGDTDAADRAFKEAEDLVQEQIRSGGDCKTLQLNLLRNRSHALSRAAESQPNNRSLQDRQQLAQNQITAVENNQEGSACR